MLALFGMKVLVIRHTNLINNRHVKMVLDTSSMHSYTSTVKGSTPNIVTVFVKNQAAPQSNGLSSQT